MRAIKYHALTIALLGAFAAGTWAYEPGVARACCSDRGLEDLKHLPVTIFTLPTLLVSVVFMGADINYGLGERENLLPPGWAIAQLLLAATSNIAVGTFYITSENEFSQLLPVTHFVLGTWFLLHSI